jgi:glyoxylase-like metal-dependent hydrolase (beta-lactamase superfamily II)
MQMPAQLATPMRQIVRRAGDVRIHSFISSFEYDDLANATHIIESKNKLVLIDGQFLTPYAKQFRAYADSLSKPIDRLYLSHRHPDHWFGLGTAFEDVSVYALEETIDFIKRKGEATRQDHLAKLQDLAPDKILLPQNVVEPGKCVIDGVTYLLDKVVDTEIDFLLTIRLPELGIYIAQDLIYSGTHLYLYGAELYSTDAIARWRQVLQDMLDSDYDLFLPGHGFHADKAEVARNSEYLAAAKQAIDSGLKGGAFRDFMKSRYPERKCAGIFDIYLPRLFGSGGQY